MQMTQATLRCVHNSDSISHLCLSTKCTVPFICTDGDCQASHEVHSDGSKPILFDEFLGKWMIARQAHTVTHFIEFLDEIQKHFGRFISQQKAKLLMWSSLLKQNNMGDLSKATGKELGETWELIRQYSIETQTQINEQLNEKKQKFGELIHELTVKLPKTSSCSETTGTIKEPEEEISRSPQKRQEIEKRHAFEERLRRCQSDYSLIVELEPETSNQYLERGKLHQKQRKEDVALSDYSRAIELDSKNIMAIFKRAMLYTSRKNYQEAESDYSKYLLLDRSSAFVWSNRALIYQAQGRVQEALSDLNTALQIEPMYEQGIISRAKLFLNEKQYDRSLADFNRFIQLNKKNTSAYHGRGKIHVVKNKFQDAIFDFTNAYELDHTNIAALIDRANSYHSIKKLDLAERDYSDAIRFNSSIGSLYYNRAVILLARKEEDRAITDLQKCLELSPNNEPATNLLSSLYLAKKKYQQAEKLLSEVMRKHGDQSNSTSIRYNLATAKKYNNHVESAIEDYTIVIQHSPSHLHSYLGRAASYMQLRRYKEALADYTKSLQLDPGNLDIIYNIGVANDSQGNVEAARSFYSLVLEKQPNHLVALKARARCNFRLSDESAFAQDSKRVQELEPDT